MAKLTPQERWELSALRHAETRELIKSSIRQRWALPDWDITFPWWREPSIVRILIYAEGRVSFENGLFRGMAYVTTLLKSRAYFYVDFEIATAHRNSDCVGASIQGKRKLTELDILNKFDEIWFFGEGDQLSLTVPELDLLKTFMSAPKYGGVLVTGDHLDRGKSISGGILRAGKMRKYPSPDVVEPCWNNSLEEGSDPNCIFDFNDQSDDLPQTIELQLFPSLPLPGFKQDSRPHPVLCGPDGPIDVLPDHQHEGQAAAPAVTPDDREEWPMAGVYQEPPVVIAKGKGKEPNSVGRQFDIMSAYDGHNVDVGRIVADASWHHWFDANITGIPGSPIYKGFKATPEGEKALKKIDAFFLNCGAWLAPPARQREMRHAAWWSILWTDQIAELSPDLPFSHLGAQALSALRLYASAAAASDWVVGAVPLRDLLSENKLGQISETLNIPLEQYFAGGILRSLMTTVGPFNPEKEFPYEAPSDIDIESLMNRGIEDALSRLKYSE